MVVVAVVVMLVVREEGGRIKEGRPDGRCRADLEADF
jgi:hypothetical protein